MKLVVAPLAEFMPGTSRIVRAGKREIGVFRVGDDFYAVRNRCPHQGGPLCEGSLWNKVVSDEPGVVEIVEGAPLVMCPWHGWGFDARTGEAYAPGDPAVRAYDVGVESGRSLDACEPEVKLAAETFSVTVENDYVVLEA